jgi:regulator of sirC expression with transglutaminase-like and TPR domain
MDTDETLDLLAHDPAAPVDTAALNLALAADEYPGLDPTVYLARIDALADALRPRLAGRLADRVRELSRLLFVEEGFRGNDADYYDPRNSYLNEVLDRRLGLPIALSVLAEAVGRPAGLAVSGVGLPGHFVARADAEGEVLFFDPFHGGRFLAAADCARLAAEATGEAPADVDLSAVPAGAVARRMLTNLKGVYLRRGDFLRAARVGARLVRLLPREVIERRDLGVCLLRSGQPGRALDHLEAYLSAETVPADAEAVRGLLAEARKELARWN